MRLQLRDRIESGPWERGWDLFVFDRMNIFKSVIKQYCLTESEFKIVSRERFHIIKLEGVHMP